MKKLIITLLCLGIVGGGSWLGYSKYMAKKQESKIVDVVPVTYMAQPAEYFDYSSSELYGTIASANSQKVYVDTNKLVAKVLVKKGDEVKKGDTILEYDMTVVELELAQKENQVKVTEQAIKTAQRTIAEYKTYKPVEDAPKEPDPVYPEEPEEPVIPDIPEEPEMPLKLEEQLVSSSQPYSGTGTPEDPLIYNVTPECVITQPFLMRVHKGQYFTELWVYSPEGKALYKWVIEPQPDQVMDMRTNISASAGLVIDELTGAVTLSEDQDEPKPGKLVFSVETQDSEDYYPEDYFEPDYEEPDYSYEEPVSVPSSNSSAGSNDYIYTRSEIARMIAEQESEIKQLQIELKGQQLELDNAKKQKSDGKVVATVDGIVKKIGTAGDASEPEEEEPIDEEYYEDEPLDEEYYEDEPLDDNAFAIIEGDGGLEVICGISELRLPEAQPGTMLSINSWETGAFGTAEIVSVDEEPYSYTAQNWSDNPQNSTYQVHARLLDTEEFSVGNWVSCNLITEAKKTNSVYLPIHYVRQEGGEYYVMKDDGKGRLVKQYVKAGAIMWQMIEIKAGLSSEDKICFPYGPDAQEGVKTRDSEEVLYPEGYY